MPLLTPLRPRGLGAYLALAFTLLSIVLTLILVQVIGVAASDQVKARIGEGLADLAMQAADKLDRGMFERYREVRLMAARPEITRNADPAEKRRLLESLQESYPYYAWIGLAAPDGTVEVATRGMLEGANVGKRPWFVNVSKGVFAGDVHEAVLLAKLLPRQSNEPIRFVDVAFPYVGQDGARGILGVHMSWAWAKEVQDSIFGPNSPYPDVEAIIASRAGKVLLGPEGTRDRQLTSASLELAKSGKGYTVETWPDGKTYLVGYAQSKGYGSYPGLGWTILVREDVDKAFAPLRSLQRNVLFSGLLVAAIFSLLGLVAARHITRPIEGLASAARRLRAGEQVPLAAMDASYREVGDLSESLSTLVRELFQQKDAVHELNVGLEQRVTARTVELARVLDEVRLNEMRIQTIIDSAQAAYVAADMNGMIIEWNTAAKEMFGWSKAAAIGKPLMELVVPERFHDKFMDALMTVDQSAGFLNRRIQRVVMDRDGREFVVEVTIDLVDHGGKTFFSAFLHDISQRLKIEQMKSEFISTVSHELRTPMTSIRASLSMLVDGMAGELPPDIAGLIRIAHSSSERLVRLVNDVLDMEKIESGNMEFHFEQKPLASLLEQAANGMSGLAAQNGVSLSHECAPALTARIDSDRMAQVLANLFSNALKFSPKGGEVVVRAEAMEQGVRIAVSDQGPGIPAAFRERIFQKFAQADGTNTRKLGGTGLGLSICRAIVEQHGGKVSFDGAAGVGTVFYVDLPA